MRQIPRLDSSDVVGFVRLVTGATTGVTGIVQSMHSTILRTAGFPSSLSPAFVYDAIRLAARAAGSTAEIFSPLAAGLTSSGSSATRESIVAAVNGVVGDHLAASQNPLAIPMRFRRDGLPVPLGEPSENLLVLVHGLCMHDLQWTRSGHNHGQALARDCGWTPVYLHYNTGLSIAENGRALAALLDTLSVTAGTRRIGILAHSLGGLVARIACEHAAEVGYPWLSRLRRLVFLGTPHHGSHWERGGNLLNTLIEINRHTAPLARIGHLRSAGITGLRYGLRHAPLVLPRHVRCYAVAASLSPGPSRLARGDGLVTIDSAFGPVPASRCWVGYGMNHADLLGHPAVYRQLRTWLRN